MKKFLIYLITISIIFTVSCASSERNKSLINYNENSTQIIYPEFRNNNKSQYLSQNQNLINYFYANNIKEYKYTLSGNTLKIWIKNYENMTEEQKAKIKTDLMKFYDNIEIVNNEQDIK